MFCLRPKGRRLRRPFLASSRRPQRFGRCVASFLLVDVSVKVLLNKAANSGYARLY